MLAAHGAVFHRSFLADDTPVTRPRKKEGMAVKLVPILHSSAVDFRGHAARIHQRAGVDGQLVAPLTNFERSLTGHCTLTPLGVNAEFVFDTAETFFVRAGHRSGNSGWNANRNRVHSRVPGTRTDRTVDGAIPRDRDRTRRA